MSVFDLSIELSPETTVFPGDPTIEIGTVCHVDKGDTFTLRHYHLGNHTGTHIDFPAHVIKGGKCSTDYPIGYLMGKAKIIEVKSSSHVTLDDIRGIDIERGDIIFFKTENSRRRLHEKGYTEDFCAVNNEVATALIAIGVKIVGIDYLSVDKYEDEPLPTHHVLLENNVLIVENLNLMDVPAGDYFVTISPLRVKDADGLPARVTAMTALAFSGFPLKADSELKPSEFEKNRRRGTGSQITFG